MSSLPHKQVVVKVNAAVDEGIVEVVSALSAFPWVVTVESCQGEPGPDGRPAGVSFFCGDWRKAAVFVHARLAPALALPQITHALKVYDAGVGNPMVEIEFPAEAAPEVASAIHSLQKRLTSASHS